MIEQCVAPNAAVRGAARRSHDLHQVQNQFEKVGSYPTYTVGLGIFLLQQPSAFL